MTLDLDALSLHRTVDITTPGRRTGKPHRIEIWWFRVAGRFVITGSPGRRDWVANLAADPRLIVHVDGYDLDATASFIDDAAFRRRVFTRPDTSWYNTQSELDHLVAKAPMVEIHFT